MKKLFEECKWCNENGDDGSRYNACPDGGHSADEFMDKEIEGITTIENVREQYKKSSNSSHMMTRIMMKAWLNYSESRTENGNSPYTFDIYVRYKYVGLKI